MSIKERFMVSECIQLDIISDVEQDSEWQEKNYPKVEMLIQAKGFTTSDILSTEMSEDSLKTSFFLLTDVKSSAEMDYRGYPMSVGDYVVVGDDSDSSEIFRVVHGDGYVEYFLKVMSVVGVFEEEI